MAIARFTLAGDLIRLVENGYTPYNDRDNPLGIRWQAATTREELRQIAADADTWKLNVMLGYQIAAANLPKEYTENLEKELVAQAHRAQYSATIQPARVRTPYEQAQDELAVLNARIEWAFQPENEWSNEARELRSYFYSRNGFQNPYRLMPMRDQLEALTGMSIPLAFVAAPAIAGAVTVESLMAASAPTIWMAQSNPTAFAFLVEQAKSGNDQQRALATTIITAPYIALEFKTAKDVLLAGIAQRSFVKGATGFGLAAHSLDQAAAVFQGRQSYASQGASYLLNKHLGLDKDVSVILAEVGNAGLAIALQRRAALTFANAPANAKEISRWAWMPSRAQPAAPRPGGTAPSGDIPELTQHLKQIRTSGATVVEAEQVWVDGMMLINQRAGQFPGNGPVINEFVGNAVGGWRVYMGAPSTQGGEAFMIAFNQKTGAIVTGIGRGLTANPTIPGEFLLQLKKATTVFP